jgi:hypothetical protein
MNIFYLSNDVVQCAQFHVDKHCVKMILEYAQLLSTAHRVLDGVEYIDPNAARKVKRWKLSDNRDSILYSATHINHPSAIWARESRANYDWLWNLLNSLCSEYTYRYGKIHKVQHSGLLESLKLSPNNIKNRNFTEPTPAMPDNYKVLNDSLQSYINYYINDKVKMFKWKNRDVPYFAKKV